MKKPALFLSIVVLAAIGSAMGQKIETQASTGAAITRIQTALNHLTVIQLSEPVLWVAAGSPVFKVEWRENKVFIEPTEPNASTNLFIWTKSGRLNYELEPAGEVAQMHFAIDQPPLDPPASKAPTTAADPPGRPSVDESAALLGGRPVRMSAYKPGRNGIQLWIKDLFQRDDRLFIRYAVENWSSQAYEVATPRVFLLEAPRGPNPIGLRRNSQLSDSQARR